jgi:hypothetical protein
MSGQADIRRINFTQRAGHGCIDDMELLPAAHAHRVADFETLAARGDDLAGRAPDHDLVERLRGGVAFPRIHAAAHVRVEAQVMMSDQHLSDAELGNPGFHQSKIIGRRLPGGARHQVLLLIENDARGAARIDVHVR